ncbi:MAG: melibiase, partial [Verrucomicrobia bacterium]|nr:melibiase [Verrucomicrobiota bacterium]
MKRRAALLLFLACSALPAAETVWLDTLDLSSLRQGWGRPQINRSIREQPLTIAGKVFARGVGTHANATFRLLLNRGAERFQASVGVDDAAGPSASVVFQIVADGKRLFGSGPMKRGQAARAVDVDVRGVRVLQLLVTDAGDGITNDH